MSRLYSKLLDRIDVRKMAQHSVLNHHANGMHYLCLHRSDDLTVKIYFMEETANPNSDFLVHPHSHRYAFETTVLVGVVEHVLFDPAWGKAWQEFEYRMEHKTLNKVRDLGLTAARRAIYDEGDTYFVKPDEVHTLRMLNLPEPVVLGLTQYQDERAFSELYLPAGCDEPVFPDSRQPTPDELDALCQKVRALFTKRGIV